MNDLTKIDQTKRYQNPLKVGLVMLLVGTAIAVVQYKIPTIMIALTEYFAISASEASWLMSIFLLVGVFVALPAGSLTERFGFKKMILAALLLALLGAALGLAAFALQSSAWLIASRALEGIALTVITAAGPIAINQCVHPTRVGTGMGLWGNWGTCGSTIASFLSPTIAAAAGFEWIWIAVGAIVIIAALALLLLIKEPSKAAEPQSQTEAQALGNGQALTEAQAQATSGQTNANPDSPSGLQMPAAQPTSANPNASQGTLARYRQLFTRDSVLFLLGFASFNMILLALLSYLPAILQLKGFDPALSGFATSFPLLLSMISVPVFGMLTDRFGKVKPFLLGTHLILGPAVCLMFNNTGIVLWITAALLGLIALGCIGLFLIGWSKVIPRPELVPIGMGVLILIQCVGQFLGTFITQLLLGANLHNTLLAGVIIACIGLAGTAALAMSRFPRG